MIITDGDAQEFSMLDIAIETFSPQVKRMRCGWHIVNAGWKKYIEGKKSLNSRDKVTYDHIRDICKSWIYSFMKYGYCENRDEYIFSKNLFKKFLQYTAKKDCFLKLLVTNIMTWFKNHVEVHETYYCFYHKVTLLCFGEWANCIIEGIHNSMKSSATPVLPSHSLTRSVAIISKNSERMKQQRVTQTYDDFVNERTYNSCNESKDILEYAYESIKNAANESTKYICIKTTSTEFLVTRNIEDFPYKVSPHIPRFHRCRKVTFQHSKLVCNCPRGKVWGLLCPHTIAIAKRCNASYVPTKNDISCIWWKSYAVLSHLVTKPGTSEYKTSEMFRLLRKYEIVGASVTHNQVSDIGIHTGRLPLMFERLLKGISCINYSSADHEKLLNDTCPGNMLSQTNVNINKYHSDSSDDDQVTFDIADPSLDFGLEDKFSSIINSEEVTYNDPRSNPYGYLKMSFSELTDVLKYHATNEEILEIKSYMDTKTTMMMKRARKSDNECSAIVSSNVEYKKNRKSHGTKY